MKPKKVTNKRRVWVGIACIALLQTTALPARAQLNDECTVTVNGQTVAVSADGSFLVTNIPAGQELLRVHVTCQNEGITLYGVSEFFPIQDSQTYDVQNVTLSPTPLATTVSLTAAVDDPILLIGETTQVNVTALLADGSEVDVTPRVNGTTYTSSNLGVLTVDQEGFAVAQGIGTSFVTTNNSGAAGTVRIDVVSQLLSTTVEGFVFLTDGTPVGGATVGVIADLAGIATVTTGDPTGADGSFAVQLPDVPAEAVLTVSAFATLGGEVVAGSKLVGPPVPDGITDAGIVVVESTITDGIARAFSVFNNVLCDSADSRAFSVYNDALDLNGASREFSVHNDPP